MHREEDSLSIVQLVSCRGWSSDAWNALSLTRGLQDRGHRVFLVCRRGEGEPIVRRAHRAGIERILTLSFKTGLRPGAWWEDIQRIRRLCREEGVQILHAHRGQEHWLSAAALRLPGFPGPSRPALFRSRHILEPVRAHPLNRWLYNGPTDRTIAVTEGIRRGYLRSGVFQPGRFAVIRGGVDCRAFRPDLDGSALRKSLGLIPQDVAVGMAASFIPIKGHLLALEALALLRRRGLPVVYLLASSGGDEEKIRGRALEVGLSRWVHFLGYQEDLPSALAATDLGLFPSLQSEGTSRALLEFMAMGRPVVAAEVGCVRELLADGEEGLIVPPRDPEALAYAMEKLALDPEGRRRMGASCRRRAERDYSRDVMVSRMEALYRQILSERSLLPPRPMGWAAPSGPVPPKPA